MILISVERTETDKESVKATVLSGVGVTPNSQGFINGDKARGLRDEQKRKRATP